MRWRAQTIVQLYCALRASRPQLKRDPLGCASALAHGRLCAPFRRRLPDAWLDRGARRYHPWRVHDVWPQRGEPAREPRGGRLFRGIRSCRLSSLARRGTGAPVVPRGPNCPSAAPHNDAADLSGSNSCLHQSFVRLCVESRRSGGCGELFRSCSRADSVCTSRWGEPARARLHRSACSQRAQPNKRLKLPGGNRS